MDDLIHIAALGALLTVLARLSLLQWRGGPRRRPVAIRVGRRRD